MEASSFRMKEFAKVTGLWWHQWHGEMINERLLSRFGVVIHQNNEAIAVAHIYPVSTCDMAWIGFTVCSPYISKIRAGRALKLLIEKAEEEVKKLGYSVVYTAFDAPALQKIVAARGYYPGSNVKEYFKELK